MLNGPPGRSDRFAWVSVDEKDNDPIVLLTYVAVALDRVSPLDPSVFDALALAGVSVEGTVVPRLGASLAKMSEQVVLVLDDLHLLDNPACLDAIEALTRHVVEGSQMALSARGRPALPSAALRARGLALEIGPNDLRMNEAEAGQLLSGAGLDPADDQVAELTEQTEGWPAGLYLAALSIRARGPRANSAAPFSGNDRLVSDYLSSELLAQLPAADLRFLTRTAVLGRMSGPLCDEVLEVSGSAAILESYARSNLFVIPLDAARGVVPLPPSVSRAAAFGSDASRAGPHTRAAHARMRMVRGARASSTPRSGTRRRPGTSIGRRG